VRFIYVFTIYLRFTPSIILPHFPLLRTISADFTVLCSYKYIKCTHFMIASPYQEFSTYSRRAPIHRGSRPPKTQLIWQWLSSYSSDKASHANAHKKNCFSFFFLFFADKVFNLVSDWTLHVKTDTSVRHKTLDSSVVKYVTRAAQDSLSLEHTSSVTL
jgi:hypothetical protein